MYAQEYGTRGILNYFKNVNETGARIKMYQGDLGGRVRLGYLTYEPPKELLPFQCT